FYPNLKDNIIVFDDNSTDGTKEWLEQKHIKMITWKYYKHLLSKDIPGKNLNHTKRISLMNSEIMIQTNTKYLLINDSDVVFLRSGFIEQYLNLVNECDYSCLVHKQYKPIKHEIKQHFPKYLKYTKKIKIMIVLFKFIHFIYLWI
ncbi:MAG: glycosyltransferase, partial [archaeon]